MISNKTGQFQQLLLPNETSLVKDCNYVCACSLPPSLPTQIPTIACDRTVIAGGH